MPVIEKVMRAFRTPGKTGKSPVLPQRRKTGISAGKQFMCITLVADIPYKSIMGTAENAMERNSQFDDT
jgi:hypothetical protein